MAEIRDAIRTKINPKGKKPSQLDAVNPNTVVAGRQMAVGGDVVVQISHGEVSKVELDRIIVDLTPELVASSAQKIVISAVDDTLPGAGRQIFEYVRNGSTFVGSMRLPYSQESRSRRTDGRAGGGGRTKPASCVWRSAGRCAIAPDDRSLT